ncbi:HNH endonuclease [Lactiplantibacillus plantarum]|uniref:NUMOD4 domain-containing protein n=1 Tax=Lactiplantibacillus plantarum TaxID=1590 RepID=UPI002841709F|nr:NUMOD4 domain-containing protein [Lactiplantibacillus plantarum]MDR4073140.1 HNH endonuclease [Lactiplantibacillus plantarum]
MDNIKIEVWKTYPEFSFVEVSTFGRVRTLDRVVTTKKGTRAIKGQSLKQQCINSGYMVVYFHINGKTVGRLVHRLVAQTFIPNLNNCPEVNHKDNNPANNCVSNLEWCTHEYNMQYKEKYGKSAEKALGHPVFAVNLETLEVLRFPSQYEASRSLGIKHQRINGVIKGKHKTTHGYYFTYADDNAVEATRDRFDDVVAYKVKKLIDNRECKAEQQWLHDFINEMKPA